MRLTVNAQEHEVVVQGHETLLAVLREQLELTGTKLGCARGECGACTVLVNGRAAYSCLTLAAGCASHSITTVEGLAAGQSLHALQRAFIEHDALQCGYCTPGQLMAAVALLARHPAPSVDEIRDGMSGNLCRCGAYPKIVRAVQAAAVAMRADSSLDGVR
ncbi:MAG: (2Fe-2S)-binding protein [Gemmatimonadaceae bacterium]|nr:(2Fe-2S)-binding protein [Gemmatimonadaceae bacterium]